MMCAVCCSRSTSVRQVKSTLHVGNSIQGSSHIMCCCIMLQNVTKYICIQNRKYNITYFEMHDTTVNRRYLTSKSLVRQQQQRERGEGRGGWVRSQGQCHCPRPRLPSSCPCAPAPCWAWRAAPQSPPRPAGGQPKIVPSC